MEKILAGLGNRVFLMNNVHEDEPVVFQSRWALSFLRGPIGRDQIALLMRDKKEASPISVKPAAASLKSDVSDAHPVLPPGINETFIHRSRPLLGNSKLIYRAGLQATARIRFNQASAAIDECRDVTIFLPAADQILPTIWDQAEISSESNIEQESKAEADSGFAPLPSDLSRAKTFNELQTALKDHLYRTQRIQLWKCPELKQVSQPDEMEGDFRARMTHGIRESRDLLVEKLRAKFAPKLATAQEQLRKALQRVEKEKSQASQQTFNAALNLGTSILGAVFGRKLTSSTNLGKAATTIRSAGRVASERQDVAQAEETVEAIQTRLKDLNSQFETEAAKLVDGASPENVKLEEITITPKKTDISIVQLSLCWTPWIVEDDGTAKQGW